MWPESLTLGGIKKDGLIYSYYKKLCEKIYGNVDKIMISSRMFSGYLKDDAVLSMSFSEKFQSYMAAGNPIVAALNGEATRIISEIDCGIISSVEDADGLVCCIEKLDKAQLGEFS